MPSESGKASFGLILFLIYLAAAFAYLFYGLATGTGLVGFIIYYQFHWFGSADDMATIFAALLVLSVPAIIGAVIASQFISESNAQPAVAAPPPAPSKPNFLRRWSILVLVSCVAGAIPCVVYLTQVQTDKADQQRTIYRLDLARPVMPPADAKFVALAGYDVLKLQYRYEETTNGTKTSYTLVPLVETGWSSGKPVVYFLKSSLTRLEDPLNGRLERDAMPVYARKAFEQRGLVIPARHYIVHPATFRDGKVVPSADSILLWVGLFLGVLSMIFGSIIVVKWGKPANRPV